MTDDLLVLAHCFAMLNSPQGRILLGSKHAPIDAEDTYTVLAEKFAHRLVVKPGCAPYSCGGAIGQHQPRIASAHQVDTDGQFVKDHLQQCPARLRLGMDAALEYQPARLCHVVPDDQSA